MGMGSYFLGSQVKIPIQVMINNVPYSGTIPPIIEKIIQPDGTLAAGFPANALSLDTTSSSYYYTFVPPIIGDYIVIIKTTISGTEYYTHENFTVNSKIVVSPKVAPRAIAR